MSLPKILTVHKGQVVIDESVLSIPEFKECYEMLGIDYLQYIWARYDPESPYGNFDQYEIDGKILADIPSTLDMNDIVFIMARNKAEELYYSPIRDIMDGAKELIKKLSTYMRTTEIVHGRDGNVTAATSAITKLEQIIKSYLSSEASYKQEVQKSRGGQREAVDADFVPDWD
jgi:uncharacterized protein (UPF0262 family)